MSTPSNNSSQESISKTQLIAFNAISKFVAALSDVFGKAHHSLALYARLIDHISLSNEKAIIQIVDSFSDYIKDNIVAIEANDQTKLSDRKIMYSLKAYLQPRELFAAADADTRRVMWKHLLTIYGILNPASHAKEILKNMPTPSGKTNETSGRAETEMITEMMQKLIPHIDANETNPMNAVMGLMSSGVFTDLVQSMQKGMDSGNIDMQSFIGTVTGMLAQPDPTAALSKATVEEVKDLKK